MKGGIDKHENVAKGKCLDNMSLAKQLNSASGLKGPFYLLLHWTKPGVIAND